jgi:putative flippase GtrA
MLASRQETRFLVIGGVNTVLGYGTFALLQSLFGEVIGYLGSLLISHVLVSLLAFRLYRRLVFRVEGNTLVDFLRFQTVYLLPLGMNAVLLPLLVGVLHWNVYLSQALIVAVSTTISFFGHKYLSFRRARVAVDESLAGTPEE